MEAKFDFEHYIERKRWKQKDAVAALGVSTGLVGSWASGTAIPSYDKIVKLIKCGITAQELFGEELGKMLIDNSLPPQSFTGPPPEILNNPDFQSSVERVLMGTNVRGYIKEELLKIVEDMKAKGEI